jgi:hypothetical protein
LNQFGKNAKVKALRDKLTNFKGIPTTKIPTSVNADLRPYQQDGFDFLCHLTHLKLGGVLADDMGLGKTLQTLCWITYQLERRKTKKKTPVLVICPASVLHNWRRESEKFAPHLKVLVLESGLARHALRKQIPENDIIITNYALLRRDLEALQKFDFSAIILDEAQYIKNPTAQVTKSVKQLRPSSLRSTNQKGTTSMISSELPVSGSPLGFVRCYSDDSRPKSPKTCRNELMSAAIANSPRSNENYTLQSYVEVEIRSSRPCRLKALPRARCMF